MRPGAQSGGHRFLWAGGFQARQDSGQEGPGGDQTAEVWQGPGNLGYSGRAKEEGEVQAELFLTLSWGAWLGGLWVQAAALALWSWRQQMTVQPVCGLGALCKAVRV